MRRLHTIDSYKKKIDLIKSSPKDIALSTDIIVGFPGEIEADFRKTVELLNIVAMKTLIHLNIHLGPGHRPMRAMIMSRKM